MASTVQPRREAIGGDTQLLNVYTGNGAPAFAAPTGSIYLRRDGGANTTLYVKETADSSTTWAAK